ncbi:MAG: hypothetical protein ACLQFW_00145 [Xanthobacteraceae bacterium]
MTDPTHWMKRAAMFSAACRSDNVERENEYPVYACVAELSQNLHLSNSGKVAR